MRIARLLLGRYGHLSDVDLSFPAASGLHIVLGPNEAGKSTALAAIGDGLFGFPHRTLFAFRHATKDLRVGLTLSADDGREASFVRCKRDKHDLLDADGNPLPESALAAFLGGATRERFDRVFGLDGAALREGGKAILEGKGDLGESILQAHTGLSGFRALAARLDRDAAQLFGDRRGRREFHVAVDAFKAARTDLDARSVEPTAYRHAREERDALIAAGGAAADEAAAAQAERARLDRIRRTAPARAALARDLPARAALGPVAALPADAETQRQTALAARERAAQTLAREQAAMAELTTQIDELVIDAALLAEGEAIDALRADRNRIEAAERDRDQQRTVATRAERALLEAAQRLGQSGDADRLLAGLPDALGRDAVDRAVRAHATLTTRLQAAQEALEAARTAAADAAAAASALPAPAPFAELRAAIGAARAEGRIDADLAAATQRQDAAAEALTTALAALPLWTGTADALAAAPVPLAPMVERAGNALRAAEEAQRTCAETLTRRRQTLDALAAELQGHLAAGTLATAEAIGAARQRRDRAWQLLRRQHIERGAAATADELAELGVAVALPAAFEGLLHEADALADRRADDATRIAAHDAARARAAQEQALQATDAAAADLARAALAEAQREWAALWPPCGVAPLDPPAMRDWLRRREEVLGKRDAAREAADARAALAARHAAAWSALAALLPEQAGVASGRLATLLRAADQVCGERESQHAARLAADKAVVSATADVTRRQAACVKLDTDLADWRAGWQTATASLGLPADAPVETAQLALQLWNSVDLRAQEWRAARDRIEEMTQAITADATAAASVVARVAPDLTGAVPQAAVGTLAERLAEARTAAASHRKLIEQQQKLARTITGLEQQHAAAENALAVLRRLAGAADDAALQDAIRRAAEHAELTRRIREREAELRGLDDGRSLAELEAQAAGIDSDALPARITAIDERLRVIAADNLARAERLAALRGTLEGMEQGHDAVAAAQAMRDTLSEIEDIAARYVRLRLAHTLLSAGIGQFRRQQQGPLLTRAGLLFARLTEGRYDRLDVDANDKGEPVVLALRPDDTNCPVERLSVGTRDQLFLALRLAAIESDAGTAERLPFIADDLLVNFDDRRALAALRVLAEFGARTQTILFTHHAHLAALAGDRIAPVHHLPAGGVPVPA